MKAQLLKIKDSFLSLRWYELIMCTIMVVISVYFAIKPVEGCPQWLAIVNLISGICGIFCVFLCAKANRINFFFAVINTTAYMIYLWYFGIFATFWLETIVYFPMNIISWVYWYKHKDEDNKLLAKSKKLSVWQNVLVYASVIVLTVITHFGLDFLAGSSWFKIATSLGLSTVFISIVKWIDSLVFSIGIIAVILQTLRYKEQYVLWIITDIISVVQYLIIRDPVYLTKKSIYLIEAVIGIKNWSKLNKKNVTNE